MAIFEVGQVVVLKSGGPNMTVSFNGPVEFPGGAVRNDLVMCQWFVGKKLESKRFEEKLLKLAE